MAGLLAAAAGRFLCWCAAIFAVFPVALACQESPGGFVLSGEVRIGGELADTGTVVLHRVSPTFSGTVDSVPVAPMGRFEFTVDAVPDSEGGDVYFASIRHQNVLYFGGPVAGAADVEGVYLIQAYPSVGAGSGTELSVRVRNVFVERAEPGPGWLVTDLFEVRNDMEATIVASEEGAAWSHALPPGALGFSVGESDLSPEAASFSGGRVFVSAPVPPGARVYLFRYEILADRFALPIEESTASMELLFREPAGELSVTGLASVGPIEMDGGTFRRFAGREMAPSVVAVEPGAPLTPNNSMPLLAALLALALTAAGSILVFRARSHGRGGPAEQRQGLLIAIARLDEEWNSGELAVDDYDRRRDRLIRDLER